MDAPCDKHGPPIGEPDPRKAHARMVEQIDAMAYAALCAGAPVPTVCQTRWPYRIVNMDCP